LGQNEETIISTGWDGTLKVWSYDEKAVKIQEVSSFNEFKIPDSDFEFKPRAVAYDGKKNVIYVGSKSNQIISYAFEDNKVDLIVDGHDGQVWGLATHPKDSVYVTGGYDNVLKLWDAEERKLLDTYTFEDNEEEEPERVTTACWSDDGQYVAFGTESSKVFVFYYDGSLHLAGQVLIDKKSKNAALENVAYVRFSPDNCYLAVAHMDSNGYIIKLTGESEQITLEVWPPMSHPAAPSNLQWSEDGRWVKFLTRSYDICHWKLDFDRSKCTFNPGIPDPDLIKWTGDPLIAGWDVQGLYQKGWDGTDLNDATLSANGKYIASGDDFGVVRLHRYPALEPSAHVKYSGHSSFVVGVEFLRDVSGEEERLITCGGNDMSIFQWKLLSEEPC